MDARGLIIQADIIRQAKGLTQAEWSRAAGLDDGGMAVSRTFNRGNCKLSTMQMLLKPLGCELKIVKVEDLP